MVDSSDDDMDHHMLCGAVYSQHGTKSNGRSPKGVSACACIRDVMRNSVNLFDQTPREKRELTKIDEPCLFFTCFTFVQVVGSTSVGGQSIDSRPFYNLVSILSDAEPSDT